MIDTNGTPREELFVEDGLHLSEKGYRVCSDALMPYLSK